MKRKTVFIAESGLLSSLAIAASALEMLLPGLPFLPPGMKIGFSNVFTMLAGKNISFWCGISVAVIKSIFVLLTRGVTAFILSLAGGITSAAVIFFIFRSKKTPFGCVGGGVIGAAVHNIAQVAVYSLFIGVAAFWYLPYLLIFGTACGILTGITLWITEKYIKINL